MSDQTTGDVAAGFGPVADAFAANSDDPGEDAAALAVFHDGVPLVDLWGAPMSCTTGRCPRTV